ncbi:hypothetical protein AB0B21_40715 [Streptomyces rimosus]|uniref:hypothetical protein n=1 Tax=Streptomyces rimosus TaxID=1927 RepID=UPI00051801C6|nr:hypothetical protein [Streptomyces rimosus]
MPLPPAAARRRPSPYAMHLAAGLGAVLSMAVDTVLNSRGHGEPLPRTLLGWALTATGCAPSCGTAGTPYRSPPRATSSRPSASPP